MRKLAFASIALASLAFAGCKKEDTAAAAGPNCAAIGAKVGEMMKKSSPAGTLPAEAQAKLDGVFAKAKDKMVARCAADKWPADFATCVEKATDPKGLDGCKLPADLEKKMMEDMQSLVPEIMAAMQGAMPVDPAAAAAGAAAAGAEAAAAGAAAGAAAAGAPGTEAAAAGAAAGAEAAAAGAAAGAEAAKAGAEAAKTEAPKGN